MWAQAPLQALEAVGCDHLNYQFDHLTPLVTYTPSLPLQMSIAVGSLLSSPF